ncbi:NAD(P)-binding protein [Phenylobacterium terrae]|uniref:NAD(P)-binding protein n=1 Tax=Phenylobacterium terrae TaxID=2665495 RepID=A0ABW4N733_9CAUL
MDEIEADYVIIGAGAAGMAFADTLLSETDASLALVDRRARPGGHWNDAYPFVRLHGPSLVYGAESRPLGSEAIEAVGINRGLLEQASGTEVLAYFDQLMRQRFLPSGRVTWLPLTDYRDGIATSRITGARTRLRATRKLVDATYADTRLPVTEPPSFAVSPEARCIPPHALPGAEGGEGFVVLGAGKTAMDTVVWLLEQGVAADNITWIRPRDPWLMPREKVQPSFDFFEPTIGALAGELEAARDAVSMADLFDRLEAAGLMTRIDRTVAPTMFRCAIVSAPELELLRRVEDVVRLGHVRAIESGRIVLDRGTIPTSPGRIHVNCTADGIPRRPATPVFQGERIVLQYVRRCSPCFSAAFIAHVEATFAGEAEKNALCGPVPAPDEPLDWLRMHLADAANRRAWSQSAQVQAWLAASRLDRFTGMIARAGREPTPERLAILQRYREAAGPALQRIAELTDQARAERRPATLEPA